MACSDQYPLSQASLLGLLPSDIDPDNVLVVATGQTVSIDGVAASVVTANVNNGVWQRIERALPRKWLEKSTANWQITSFDPRKGLVCVQYRTPQAELRFLSISVPVFRRSVG